MKGRISEVLFASLPMKEMLKVSPFLSSLESRIERLLCSCILIYKVPITTTEARLAQSV